MQSAECRCLPTALTYRLNSTGSTWSSATSMHEARARPTVVRLADGRVLVAGGFGDDCPETFAGGYSCQPLASTEIYDPVSGQWSMTAPMPQAARWSRPRVRRLRRQLSRQPFRASQARKSTRPSGRHNNHLNDATHAASPAAPLTLRHLPALPIWRKRGVRDRLQTVEPILRPWFSFFWSRLVGTRGGG